MSSIHLFIHFLFILQRDGVIVEDGNERVMGIFCEIVKGCL